MSREETCFQSVVEVIGNTPVVELSRLVQELNLDGRILAKLEYLNPGFSKKDRIACQIIEDAEKNGDLKKALKLDRTFAGARKDLAASYCNRGVAYARERRFNTAIRDYNEAVRLEPNEGLYYHNRGVAYRAQGKNSKREH